MGCEPGAGAVKDLENLRGLIDAALGKWGVGHVGDFIQLTERWGEMAGEQWAKHSTPVLLRQGALTVETSRSAASILRYSVGDLLRSIDGELGEGIVTEIRIKIVG